LLKCENVQTADLLDVFEKMQHTVEFFCVRENGQC